MEPIEDIQPDEDGEEEEAPDESEIERYCYCDEHNGEEPHR